MKTHRSLGQLEEIVTGIVFKKKRMPSAKQRQRFSRLHRMKAWPKLIVY